MRSLGLASLLVILTARAGAAASDPIQGCLAALGEGIEAVGPSRAGEVSADRSELEGILADLKRRQSDIASDRSSLESDQNILDFHFRDRDDRLAQINREQQALENDYADLDRRGEQHNADANQQHACAGSAATPAQVASCNAWGDRVDARKAMLENELRGLENRKTALENRRQTIARDVIEDARRIGELQKRRSRVERGTAEVLGECASARSRAVALKQIVNSAARTISYEPPEVLAHKVLEGIVKEGATKGLEALDVKIALKGLGKVSTKAVGTAISIADVFADIDTAGVDQRTREVEKNLFLIGDYGTVMKTMVDDKGGAATSDPRYVAMRSELERMQRDMPSSGAEVALRGLASAAAMGEAFRAAAAHYVAGKVSRAAGARLNHLNNAQRKALAAAGQKWFGVGGVKLTREATEAVSKGAADEITKRGAKNITEELRRAREER